VAWDTDREDWRTFRIDRVRPLSPTGPRFTPREAPDGDVTDYLRDGVASGPWDYRARVRIHAEVETVRAKLPWAREIEADGENRCIVRVGSDDPAMLTLYLGLLGVDFDVLDAPELQDQLRAVAERFHRASGAVSGQ
jgi:predicted DNA-binding transcriptional regulator YafY